MPRHIKYTQELLEEAAKSSTSFYGLCKRLKSQTSGNSYYHIKSLIQRFNIDISHFDGKWQRKGMPSVTKKEWHHYLIKSNKDKREQGHILRRSLIEYGRKYECEICKNTGEWNDKDLSLEVDHIDGDWKNNLPENLRFLCPNCHTQTENYGSKKNRKYNQCIKCGQNIGKTSKTCVKCMGIRKVQNRPNLEVLKKEIETLGYAGTGRKYGVTDNSIRKWIKSVDG